MNGLRPDIHGAVRVLEARWGSAKPEVLIVLGSGLGRFATALPDADAVALSELPGFPGAGVAGHAGKLMMGTLEGRSVALLAGRYHLYEGHAPSVVTAPIALAHALGARGLLVTNASGGIRRDLVPGALVLLDDHINLQFSSPLVGPVQEGESRFPDMSRPYDVELLRLAREEALREGIEVTTGVYAGVLGPSYETPAEIEMLHRLGADVVGMSTVPEVIRARALGMRVLCLSLVTNLAAGRSGDPLNHQEVMEAGARASDAMERLIRGVVARWPRDQPSS
jgi:purine-nucleoside phosphorylase